MGILITQRTTTTPGPQVKFDCPRCGVQDVAATTAAVEENNKFFWVIPFFTARWVTVTCGSCRKNFKPQRNIDELGRMSRQEISEMIAAWHANHVDFLVKVCIIAGIAISICPVVGDIFAIIGVAGTIKRRSGWRTAAFVGLGLCVICNILFFMLMRMK